MNEQTTPLEEAKENNLSLEIETSEVELPDVEIAVPDAEVSTPDVEASASDVVADVELPDVESATAESPDVEASMPDVVADAVDVDVPDAELPDVEVAAPDVEVSVPDLAAGEAEQAEAIIEEPTGDAVEAVAEMSAPESEVTQEVEKEAADLVKSVAGPPEYVPNEKMGRVQRIGNDVRLSDIDHKNVQLLSRFLDRHGRIIPRRKTHVSAKVQRQVVRAIKRARYLALLPYTGDQTRLVRKKR